MLAAARHRGCAVHQDTSHGRLPNAGIAAKLHPRHEQQPLAAVPSDVLTGETSHPLLLFRSLSCMTLPVCA
jgi:hypothetical protein